MGASAMDSAEVVTERNDGEAHADAGACPRCGEPSATSLRVKTRLLGLLEVRRCGRCGTRTGSDENRDAFVFTCESCGLPFASDDLLPHAEHRCDDCRQGRLPAELPSPEVAAAAEAEIRHSLGLHWKFVRSESLDGYLGRVARVLGERVEGAPTRPRVLLIDDAAHKTLALPSGLVLVSVGALRFLEDEAELAFVLAHELAHAGSGDAAVRLVRHGFRATQASRRTPEAGNWAEAALDLVRLGYGRRRERDADTRALEAIMGAGYDPESVVRYLERLRERVDAGDPGVAEVAVAHPPSSDRIRRIEKALYGRVRGEAVVKVNREVFRRAVASGLAAGLAPALLAPVPAPEGARVERSDARSRNRRIGWTMAVVAVVVVVAAVLTVAYLVR